MRRARTTPKPVVEFVPSRRPGCLGCRVTGDEVHDIDVVGGSSPIPVRTRMCPKCIEKLGAKVVFDRGPAKWPD